MRRGLTASAELPLDPLVKMAAMRLAFEHHKNGKLESAASVLRTFVQATDARGAADYDASNLLAECWAALERWHDMFEFLCSLQNQRCHATTAPSHAPLLMHLPQPRPTAFRAASALSAVRGPSRKEQQCVPDNDRSTAVTRTKTLRVGCHRPSQHRPLRPRPAVDLFHGRPAENRVYFSRKSQVLSALQHALQSCASASAATCAIS
jgi:hypothetical protein